MKQRVEHPEPSTASKVTYSHIHTETYTERAHLQPLHPYRHGFKTPQWGGPSPQQNAVPCRCRHSQRHAGQGNCHHSCCCRHVEHMQLHTSAQVPDSGGAVSAARNNGAVDDVEACDRACVAGERGSQGQLACAPLGGRSSVWRQVQAGRHKLQSIFMQTTWGHTCACMCWWHVESGSPQQPTCQGTHPARCMPQAAVHCCSCCPCCLRMQHQLVCSALHAAPRAAPE